MKKNKNGFTLVEILVTIAVLAVLTTIVGVSVSQILHNNNQKKVDEFNAKLEKAACAFVDYQGINESLCGAYEDLCEVTYEELLNGKVIETQMGNKEDLKVKDSDEDSGFIKGDLVNPKTKEQIKDMNEKEIASYVRFKDGEKVCCAVLENDTCPEK